MEAAGAPVSVGIGAPLPPETGGFSHHFQNQLPFPVSPPPHAPPHPPHLPCSLPPSLLPSPLSDSPQVLSAYYSLEEEEKKKNTTSLPQLSRNSVYVGAIGPTRSQWLSLSQASPQSVRSEDRPCFWGILASVSPTPLLFGYK